MTEFTELKHQVLFQPHILTHYLMVVLRAVVVTFPNRTAQSETVWAKQLKKTHQASSS